LVDGTAQYQKQQLDAASAQQLAAALSTIDASTSTRSRGLAKVALVISIKNLNTYTVYTVYFFYF
jgi:hypothetical protein